MTIQAQINWIAGMQLVARAGQGPAIIMDDPEGRSGPSPMELVLMGVAGCTAMDVVSILRKKRSTFTALQVEISGERAADYPKRYTRIHIEFIVTGTGVKPTDVEQAVRLSMDKYCSAAASLNAAMEDSYRIIEADSMHQLDQ